MQSIACKNKRSFALFLHSSQNKCNIKQWANRYSEYLVILLTKVKYVFQAIEKDVHQ